MSNPSGDRPRVWSSDRSGLTPAEQDCACPDPTPLPLLAVDATDLQGAWQRAAELYQARLTQEHVLYFAPLGRGGVVVLNASARQILNAFSTPARLDTVTTALPGLDARDVRHTVSRLAELGLLHPAGHASNTLEAGSTTLTAWLHLSNRCTLNCTYCYVARNGQDMDGATGEAAVDAVVNSAARHGYTRVWLKYSGGEPLLNFPLLRLLHERAQEQTTRQGLHLQATVLSNGTVLTDEMLSFFVSHGLRLMISLDGTYDNHNAQRPWAGGAGSFDVVAHNIDRALAAGAVPHLSITVTGESEAAPASAVAFALERQIPFNLNLVRTCATEARSWEPDEISLVMAVKRAFRAIEASLPAHSLVAGVLDRANFLSPHSLPCGAGHHYLAVDHLGRVSRCQMELDKPVGSVWLADPISAIRAPGDGFQNEPVEQREPCRRCVWRYACAGGCPLLAADSLSVVPASPPYCNAYRALYPELLRLEGLRLIQQGEA